MKDFLLLPQRVDGKSEYALFNMSHVERIVPNNYDDEQCILVFGDNSRTHIQLSVTELQYLITLQTD